MEQQRGHLFPNKETAPISVEHQRNASKITEARIARVMRDMHDGASSSLARSAQEAWSSNSIYQSEDYEFSLYAPEGQCGVTNFTLGIILTWSGIVSIDNIYYEEGTIKGRDGILSEHHAWIKVVDGDQSWRIDLTPHQYVDINPDPDASMHMVLQSMTNNWTGTYAGINQRQDTGIPVPNSYSLQYEAHTTTPLEEYDITQFEGRLERFMGRLGVEPVLGASKGRMPDSNFRNFWYPNNYDFSEESTEKEPGDFLGTLELEEMLELISKSNGSQQEKLRDMQNAYINHRERLLKETRHTTLVTWTEDCVEHILPYLEPSNPFYSDILNLLALSQDETIEWNQETIESRFNDSYDQLAEKIYDGDSHDKEFTRCLSYAVRRLVKLKASIHVNPYESSSENASRLPTPLDYAHWATMSALATLYALEKEDTELLSELIWQVEHLEELMHEDSPSMDTPIAPYYHPAGEAIKAAKDLDTYTNNIEALADQATPEILMVWLEGYAKRVILQFLAEIPYDSILLKNIRREAEDDTWNRTDTMYEFGKYVYEHERLYKTYTTTLAAHVAAVFYYVQEIDPTQRKKHWTEIKRIILEAADFAAQAAIHNQETALSERAWQHEYLSELITHGPSSVKPFSYPS